MAPANQRLYDARSCIADDMYKRISSGESYPLKYKSHRRPCPATSTELWSDIKVHLTSSIKIHEVKRRATVRRVMITSSSTPLHSWMKQIRYSILGWRRWGYPSRRESWSWHSRARCGWASGAPRERGIRGREPGFPAEETAAVTCQKAEEIPVGRKTRYLSSKEEHCQVKGKH